MVALAVPLGIAVAWYGIRTAWGNSTWPGLSGALLFVVLATSAITDLRSGKIPNWITYTAVLWALVINIAGQCLLQDSGELARNTWKSDLYSFLGPVGLGQSVGGFLICFLTMFVVFLFTSRGAGDVKLAAAAGAFLGVRHGLMLLAAAYLAAGLGSLAWMIWKRGPVFITMFFGRIIGAVILPLWILPPTDDDKQSMAIPVPLGPFFALAGLLVLLGEPYL